MPQLTFSSISDLNMQNGAIGHFNTLGSVHVWIVKIPESLHLLQYATGILSSVEQERAERYHYDKDEQRFIVNRVALRVLLGKYSGQKPGEIELVEGPSKKPFLKNKVRDIHYNVSHSGDCILIAVSEYPVGADIEYMDEHFEYEEILAACFSDGEGALMKGATQPRALFYCLWTRKEALIKATAKGIDDELRHVPCIDGSHSIEAHITGSEQDWVVNSFVINREYTCSIAYDPRIADVKFYDAGKLLIDL